jgi:GNAT superfamily N-acetyltransferase
MSDAVSVRPFEAADTAATMAVVRALPDYFTDDVPDKVGRDAAGHDTWVLDDSGQVVGFAIVATKSPGGAEVLWMAVAPAHRGRGYGTLLLDHVLAVLADRGISVVEVKTLDASAGYQPYVATRAFWERGGFVQIDTIDPLPGWQPGNPAAIYAAALRATR